MIASKKPNSSSSAELTSGMLFLFSSFLYMFVFFFQYSLYLAVFQCFFFFLVLVACFDFSSFLVLFY